MDWKALTYIKRTKKQYWCVFFVVMLVINKAHEFTAPGNTLLFPFGLKTLVPGDELALFLRIRG